jgi:hypothetical protein
MPYYRLYFFDGAGRIEHFNEFEAATDVLAMGDAGQMQSGARMELWSRARKVKTWAVRQPLAGVESSAGKLRPVTTSDLPPLVSVARS